MKQKYLSHKFVKFLPEQIEEGVLYISNKYRTAAHKCCCGCGKEVITPIKPTNWSLKLDGNLVSLFPSIGNWSLSCRSHYWIKKSKVIWAVQMSEQEIECGRALRRYTTQKYFEAVNDKRVTHSKFPDRDPSFLNQKHGLFHKLWKGIKKIFLQIRQGKGKKNTLEP